MADIKQIKVGNTVYDIKQEGVLVDSQGQENGEYIIVSADATFAELYDGILEDKYTGVVRNNNDYTSHLNGSIKFDHDSDGEIFVEYIGTIPNQSGDGSNMGKITCLLDIGSGSNWDLSLKYLIDGNNSAGQPIEGRQVLSSVDDMLLRACGIGGPDYNDCFRGSAIGPVVELPLGWASHSEGDNALALGGGSHAEGFGEDVGSVTAAYISSTNLIGAGSDVSFIVPGDVIVHPQDKKWAVIASVDRSGSIYTSDNHGFSTNIPTELLIYRGTASGPYSHVEGALCSAAGHASHAEGSNSHAYGSESHTEGFETFAYNIASHAEGYQTVAKGEDSHAEGYLAEAEGDDSHAEGVKTYTGGWGSHAEGFGHDLLTINNINNDNSYAVDYTTPPSIGTTVGFVDSNGKRFGGVSRVRAVRQLAASGGYI